MSRKSWRRHTIKWGSIGTVLLALFGGSGYAIWQDVVARHDRYQTALADIETLKDDAKTMKKTQECFWALLYHRPCNP